MAAIRSQKAVRDALLEVVGISVEIRSHLQKHKELLRREGRQTVNAEDFVAMIATAEAQNATMLGFVALLHELHCVGTEISGTLERGLCGVRERTDKLEDKFGLRRAAIPYPSRGSAREPFIDRIDKLEEELATLRSEVKRLRAGGRAASKIAAELEARAIAPANLITVPQGESDDHD